MPFPVRRPLIERFSEKVDRKGPDECWLCTAAVNNKGYGLIGNGKKPSKQVLAHRLAYQLHYGAFDETLHVLHRCDTPRCCNPKHLFLGTHKENMADCKAKGRHHKIGRTNCPRGHAYLPDNFYLKRDGTRLCKSCHVERVIRYREKRRIDHGTSC